MAEVTNKEIALPVDRSQDQDQRTERDVDQAHTQAEAHQEGAAEDIKEKIQEIESTEEADQLLTMILDLRAMEEDEVNL